MKIRVFDIEANGLNPTRIFCLSIYYQDKSGVWIKKSTTNYEDMRKFFLCPQILVGHYIKMYDIPVVERILGIKIPKESIIIDTCTLSWVLYPERPTHGLEDWGVHFGSLKVKIGDEEWDGIGEDNEKILLDWEQGNNTGMIAKEDIEEILRLKKEHSDLMIERCEGDIEINLKLWQKQEAYLKEIYSDDSVLIKRYINYLMFKMDCLHDQEQLKVNVNVDRVNKNIAYFLPQKEEKELELCKYMPKIAKKSKKNKPKKMYTKDGELSALGTKWFDLLEEGGFPQDWENEVVVINGWDEPNPSSPDQVKEWLLSIGWTPLIYKKSTLKDGTESNTPQVRNADRQLCKSVLNLIKEHPEVEILDGLTVINHRLGVLKSFLNALDENNKVIAGASGFTNTLRLKHVKPIANLPKVTGKGGIRDGQWIRECLVAPEGYEFCGADMSSLEDRSKQHYIYDYDPQYVQDMMTPDFDPHLDLAVAAGALTEEQSTAHKNKEANYGAERHIYKTANYSAIYGVGPKTLSVSLDCTFGKAKEVLESYWERNWSVKQLAKDQFVQTVQGQMWQRNPLNGFFYSLRYDKDRFSTLNQGGATYIFDTWVYNMRAKGVIPCMQYHDEKLSLVEKKEGERERIEKIMKDSVYKVNRQLKLKRDMDVDVQFGDNYADVH